MTRVAFETAAKIRRLVHIRAFVIPDGDEEIGIESVSLEGDAAFVTEHVVSHPSEKAPRTILLEVYAIAKSNFAFDCLHLTITVMAGTVTSTLSFDFPEIQKRSLRTPYSVMQTWRDLVARKSVKRIIDIGGRARSGVSRKGSMPGKKILVADIIPAKDVDYVADVHTLSDNVHDTFDAFMSIAAFEHFLMPWKAAVEINRVLRIGAIGLVVTHQTVGVHDVPWDFFRYSDNAWKGIFNVLTGFEIVDAGMTNPVMIIPRHWQKQFDGTEAAVGYMTSSVVVRKVGQPSLDWHANVSAITADAYPR